jgi:hypothetical protein
MKCLSGSYLVESVANRGDRRPGLGAACTPLPAPLPARTPLPRVVGASRPVAFAFFVALPKVAGAFLLFRPEAEAEAEAESSSSISSRSVSVEETDGDRVGGVETD